MIAKGNRIELREEGTLLGYARALDFVGSAVTATMAGNLGTVTVTGGGSAGALVLLSVANFTAASSADFNSSIIDTATYQEFLFSVNITVSTDDTKLCLRTDTANGASVDAGATDYQYSMKYTNSASAQADVGSAGAPQLVMNYTGASGGIGNTAPESHVGEVWVNPGDASNWPQIRFQHVYLDNTTRTGNTSGGGQRRAVGPINFVRLLPLAGTFTGTIWCYGLRAA